MFRYLHLQAYPQMHTFASLMVSGGNFCLLHNQDLPPAALPLLAAHPLLPVPIDPILPVPDPIVPRPEP